MQKTTERWFRAGALAGIATALGLKTLNHAQKQQSALAHQIDNIMDYALKGLKIPVESTFITVNDVRLHVVTAGPEEGTPIILLHGFPENWYSWRQQIPVLANAGYRVIVPDQRGYNLSDKPAGIAAYGIENLTADVRELITTLGYNQAIIVGHDWGGVVAWYFAMTYPELTTRLVVMNAPHPAAYARELRQNPSQQRKSWYVLAFQIPWLPETLLTFAPATTARRLFQQTAVRQEAFPGADIQFMAAAIAQPGAMRAAINWYRALLRYPPATSKQPITTPTLLIWGENDIALDKSLTYDLVHWVPHIKVHTILHCGHWVQNEAAGEVNRQLLEFLD